MQPSQQRVGLKAVSNIFMQLPYIAPCFPLTFRIPLRMMDGHKCNTALRSYQIYRTQPFLELPLLDILCSMFAPSQRFPD